jgi:hypothetical protein
MWRANCGSAFQRSTAIIHNKAPASGLNELPKTWAGFTDAATKLTKRDASGRVTRWGIKVAGDLGNAQTFGAAFRPAKADERGWHGGSFRDPGGRGDDFWHDLSAKYHDAGGRFRMGTCRPISSRAMQPSSSTPRAI